MDSILKSLSLAFLLRSLFGGFFFLLSYQVAAGGLPRSSDAETIVGSISQLGLALIVGHSIYSLFRGLVYPFWEYFLDCGLVRRHNLRERFPLIAEVTIDALLRSWRLPAKEGEVEKEYARNLGSWADAAHYSYLAALCIIAGSLLRLIAVPGDYVPCWTLVWLTAAFATTGMTSDWRMRRVRDVIQRSSSKGEDFWS